MSSSIMNKQYDPADRFALSNLFPCTFSRKRGRACEDESCEFMPISKRINNLHIRSSLLKANEERCIERCCHPHPSAHGSCTQTDFSMAGAAGNGRDPLGVLHSPEGCYGNATQSATLVTSSVDGTVVLSSVSPLQHVSPQGRDGTGFVYQPELNANENPHYYHVNGLLYGLHLNRLQRLGKLEL